MTRTMTTRRRRRRRRKDIFCRLGTTTKRKARPASVGAAVRLAPNRMIPTRTGDDGNGGIHMSKGRGL
jgi:hypothetical protein